MTTPTITLKSITINEPKYVGDIKGNQTASLVFAVSFGDSVQCLDVSATVVHQEGRVDHTVASAQRILLQKFQALSQVLKEQLGDSQTSCFLQ